MSNKSDISIKYWRSKYRIMSVRKHFKEVCDCLRNGITRIDNDAAITRIDNDAAINCRYERKKG
jgi:hypothetical protein